MQYHFEESDDAVFHEMCDAALKAARVALRHSLTPPTILISHDESARRLVTEFVGKDQWDCDRQRQEGQDIPELAAILAPVFKRRLTRIEVYEELELK